LWTTHTFPISQGPANCTRGPIKGRGRVYHHTGLALMNQASRYNA
jgi:hypothetical protein